MLEVGSLPAHRLVVAGEKARRLLAPFAALLPATYRAVRLLQLALRLAVVAWVLDDLPVRRDEEHVQPHLNAGLASGERQRLGGHVGTREADVPPSRLFGERDGLDAALNRAGPAHRDPSNLGEDEGAVIQPGAVAIFLVGEGVVTVASLGAREAGLLARLHPAEERLVGLVQAGEHLLQDVAVDGGVFPEVLADALQRGFLLVARDRDAAPTAPRPCCAVPAPCSRACGSATGPPRWRSWRASSGVSPCTSCARSSRA